MTKTARFEFKLDEFKFAEGDDGEMSFSGVAMGGSFVYDTIWGEKLYVRPSIWLSEDGKVVPLLLQHQKVPTYGYQTVRVSKQRITVEGRFHNTPEGRAKAVEMKSLLDAGAKPELSLGGFYALETERATKGSEKGDFTYDDGTIEEVSIVLTGAADKSSFRMSDDWQPEQRYLTAASEEAVLDTSEGSSDNGDAVEEAALSERTQAFATQLAEERPL